MEMTIAQALLGAELLWPECQHTAGDLGDTPEW
jgi:hypothetical protein